MSSSFLLTAAISSPSTPSLHLDSTMSSAPYHLSGVADTLVRSSYSTRKRRTYRYSLGWQLEAFSYSPMFRTLSLKAWKVPVGPCQFTWLSMELEISSLAVRVALATKLRPEWWTVASSMNAKLPKPKGTLAILNLYNGYLNLQISGLLILSKELWSLEYVSMIAFLATIWDCSRGILQDKPFEMMTLNDYHTAIHPKVQGTWNIHQASRELQKQLLDFFILLSSTSGIVGNKGQANYVVANTFLTAFASYRQTLGLRGNTVDLGLIEDGRVRCRARLRIKDPVQ